MTEISFCPFCGVERAGRFCSSCGANLNQIGEILAAGLAVPPDRPLDSAANPESEKPHQPPIPVAQVDLATSQESAALPPVPPPPPVPKRELPETEPPGLSYPEGFTLGQNCPNCGEVLTDNACGVCSD